MQPENTAPATEQSEVSSEVGIPATESSIWAPPGESSNSNDLTPSDRLKTITSAPPSEQPVGLSPVEEIKPCPYVNGFASDNSGVSFMLHRYEGYSDFILFDGGKPSRCFRFSAGVPERESVQRARLEGYIDGITTITNCRPHASTTHDGANTLNQLRAIGDVKIGTANDELAELRRKS